MEGQIVKYHWNAKYCCISLTNLHTSANPATPITHGPASIQHSPLAPDDPLLQRVADADADQEEVFRMLED